MKRYLTLGLVLLCCLLVGQLSAQEIQFVFTSDAHYGITRSNFQGATKVDAHVVNSALVAKMNALPTLTLPADGGLKAGKAVGTIDFVVEGGDIANRQETGIQAAAASWAQFQADYIDGLNLTDSTGKIAPLFLIPGNHDVSNAIGALNQTYAVTGFRGVSGKLKSFVSGSSWYDFPDDCDFNFSCDLVCGAGFTAVGEAGGFGGGFGGGGIGGW